MCVCVCVCVCVCTLRLERNFSSVFEEHDELCMKLSRSADEVTG